MGESEGAQGLSGADPPDSLPHRSLIDSGIANPINEGQPDSPGPSNPKDSKSPKPSKKGQRQAQEARQTGKSSVQNSDPKAKASSSERSAVSSLPEFILQRNTLFDELKQKQDAEISSRAHPEINVVIDLGRGNEKAVIAKAWESTPVSFLKDLKGEVEPDIVIAKIDGKELWDLDRPLERNCRLSYLPFGSAEGRHVFWHSSAHVLGEAAECHYPKCLLSHGPPVEQGFFYDMALEEEQVVNQADWRPLEDRASRFVKDKQPFERLHVSIADLKKMFGYSKYKMYYIENLLPKEGSTVYKCGSLVDLCLGPHIQNTNKIKAFKIMKNSSCYFRGDKDDDSLQRIYGVAFPDKKGMVDHQKFLEEAAKRDHRKIGVDQELFFFHELSPGSVFLLTHGTRIFNALQKLLRSEYHKRGYQEVQSPNMYDVDLWKTSGHWQHYQEDMFRLDVEKRIYALKPMNCPGHCLIFRHRERSYRELPLRMADFGVLHRNEASGALNGLTRVRKFQQDDTHIFCTSEQITQEIEGLFDFLRCIYGLFGFPFRLKLSTRPEKYMGSIDTWNVAEEKLRDALNSFKAAGGADWELNEGDGAFYGPKIDITISDALNREHQCATIQLDFQLPQNFGLEFITGESPARSKKDEGTEAETNGTVSSSSKEPGSGRARPVMIHRAIIGSFERFMAILTEHFAGKWPFWLSPRQILVIPVMPAVNDYVDEVQRVFHQAEFYVDTDKSSNTMQWKIRNGQQKQYNFIFVVGAQEEKSRTVNIRNRDDQNTQSKGDLVPLDVALEALTTLRDDRKLVNAI